MKLLLTSGGVTNPTIYAALGQLLGKPVAECHALVVPTAQWGHPWCGPASVRSLIAAEPDFRYFSGLGWESLGVLDAHRAAHHRRGPLGSVDPGGRCAAGRRR